MRSRDLRSTFRHILSLSLLAPAVASGAAACSGATIDDTVGDAGNGEGCGKSGSCDSGPYDSGPTLDGGGGACTPPNTKRWTQPGCNRPFDVCMSPNTPEPACYTAVCGCSGKVIAGCGGFSEPYVTIPNVGGPDHPFPAVGSACDPNPKDAGEPTDAGSGCVDTPQPKADAGANCAPWTVPLPCSFPDDANGVMGAECQTYCGGNAYWCSKEPDAGAVLHCDPGCAIGRRPEGFVLAGVTGDASTIVGKYFAAMTALEAASVFSFERLDRELAAHGAPAALRRRARRAAADERRHARVANALTKRFGGEAAMPEGAPMEIRSLEDMALENAVEGCIRETFGALTATLQADRAADPKVRAAMKRIATDETAHAGLAWAVAEWLDSQLDDAAKARIRAAQTEAIHELEAEVCIMQPMALQHLAGLPSADEAQRMLQGMTGALLAA